MYAELVMRFPRRPANSWLSGEPRLWRVRLPSLRSQGQRLVQGARVIARGDSGVCFWKMKASAGCLNCSQVLPPAHRRLSLLNGASLTELRSKEIINDKFQAHDRSVNFDLAWKCVREGA